MTMHEALGTLVAIASRWGENAEEAFPRRIEASDTDETLRELAGENDPHDELEEMIELRDLWLAVDIVQAHMKASPVCYVRAHGLRDKTQAMGGERMRQETEQFVAYWDGWDDVECDSDPERSYSPCWELSNESDVARLLGYLLELKREPGFSPVLNLTIETK